mmetsp:Transcript_8855/g.13385  ORF Transcript_8855/g.13385 Transcript_8855/m.13385 type:complete len:88 (-) Transcript_8855:543-806(-)
MGVQGLLPKMKPIMEKISLSLYRGRRCAVDIAGMMHAAMHGYGHMLIDESELTNYGRSKAASAAVAGSYDFHRNKLRVERERAYVRK